MACVTRRRGRLVLDFRDQLGRRRIITLPQGMTRKEGKIELGNILRKVEKETFKPSRQIPKFSQVAEDWLRLKKVDLRYGSYKQYRGHVRNHLVLFLGKLRIDNISYPAVERFKAYCREQEVSVATIKKILTTLGSIMTYAVRCKYIDHNSVREVEKPRVSSVDRKNIRPFTAEEFQRLLDAESNPMYRLLFKTAGLSGLRQGELFALRYSDIYWSTSQIEVCRTFNHGEFHNPKTAKSRRKVSIPRILLNELRERRLQSKFSGDSDLVFCTSVGTPLNHGNVLRRHYYPSIKRAGIAPRNFHCLRHSFASWLLQNNEPIPVVAALLGHSTPNITMMYYAHIISDDHSEVAERLGKAMLGEEQPAGG